MNSLYVFYFYILLLHKQYHGYLLLCHGLMVLSFLNLAVCPSPPCPLFPVADGWRRGCWGMVLWKSMSSCVPCMLWHLISNSDSMDCSTPSARLKTMNHDVFLIPFCLNHKNAFLQSALTMCIPVLLNKDILMRGLNNFKFPHFFSFLSVMYCKVSPLP